MGEVALAVGEADNGLRECLDAEINAFKVATTGYDDAALLCIAAREDGGELRGRSAGLEYPLLPGAGFRRGGGTAGSARFRGSWRGPGSPGKAARARVRRGRVSGSSRMSSSLWPG